MLRAILYLSTLSPPCIFFFSISLARLNWFYDVIPNLVRSTQNLLLFLLLVTPPLPRDGGMAEDHGAPETGQLPRVWTRGRKETQSRQTVSGAKSPQLHSAE